LDEQLLTTVINYLTSIITNYDEQISANSTDNLAQLEETQALLKQVYNVLLKQSMERKMKAS
jgi:hypothetical protein